MGCLGSALGFAIGFVLLSLGPALAAADGEATLLWPGLATAAGALLLALPGAREDADGALSSLARGLFAGGVVGLLVTAAFFGMGPF